MSNNKSTQEIEFRIPEMICNCNHLMPSQIDNIGRVTYSCEFCHIRILSPDMGYCFNQLVERQTKEADG